MHFVFGLLMVKLKTSRHEYVMKAATFRKACELLPDFNINMLVRHIGTLDLFISYLQEIYY